VPCVVGEILLCFIIQHTNVLHDIKDGGFAKRNDITSCYSHRKTFLTPVAVAALMTVTIKQPSI
jgi:hypothetical protein